MAVINSKGLSGITDNVTNKFAWVQSILNSKSRIKCWFQKQPSLWNFEVEWRGL